MKTKLAIKKINERGVLLVFPINNKPEPNSLWKEFHPKKKMIWEWDTGGDASVGDLWLLMKHLSDCGEVDDGAFPSLAVGSTQLLFEDLWLAAKDMKSAKAQKLVDQFMPIGSLVRKFFDKQMSSFSFAIPNFQKQH